MDLFFATAPKGLEELLAEELTRLGVSQIKMTIAGLGFSASWETACKVLLWSRLASRILFPIASFDADTPETLYQGMAAIDWSKHMSAETTFVVDANSTRSNLTHDRYAAQIAKDAIVDQFRERGGTRPSVEKTDPDVKINLSIRGPQVRVSIDLCGAALSNRGYRKHQGEAPLRENLAAAILIRAGWPAIAAEGGSLVDPMCGAGTLLVEAAMIAADIAPGLSRERFAAEGWLGFDQAAMRKARAEAKETSDANMAIFRSSGPSICGFDLDKEVLQKAALNLELAGLTDCIQLGNRPLERWKPANARGWRPGLVVTNPPYGERLGDPAQLPALYQVLGHALIETFMGWRAGVFTATPEHGKRLGLRTSKRYKLFNGPLPCELLNFEIAENWILKHGGKRTSEGGISEGAAQFRNRLKKNLKALAPWVKKEGIEAYRLYDADMPEYNVAVDIYGDTVVVSEYAPPEDIDLQKAEHRLADVLLVVGEVLGRPSDRIALKRRRKQKGENRYQPLERRGEHIEVREDGLIFLINPFDYLDVGLFNDHRPIRARIKEMAKGLRFLNLFAYTGSATVAAAAGGASSTTTVDLSNTYIDWARQNMERNRFKEGRDHRFERDDCIAWLAHARGTYDLIFLDPPTFSNSKSFEGSFEVQRDHVELLKSTARLLDKKGLLIFSNNYRRFKLDEEALADLGLVAKDISIETIPPDYSRNQKIHHCYEIRKVQ